jgi:hypothetical protein
MTGDQQDFSNRLRALLPAKWFPITAPDATESATPILDGVLAGLAAAWAWLFSVYTYANLQSRIATATDAFLDIIALDFFGTRISRKAGQSDASFRRRILLEILRPRATRAAMAQALTDLTGRAPTIFEPANSSDTGGYCSGANLNDASLPGNLLGGGVGYNSGGGYGCLAIPFQCFITAYRPHGGGVAFVSGYGNPDSFAYGAGGYGSITDGGATAGAIEYAAMSMVAGAVTDSDIEEAVVACAPVGTIPWLRISN